jgi:hypothetical protein
MRFRVAIVAGLLLLAGMPVQAVPQKAAKRYGLDLDLEAYPQKTPQEALASVVKAIEGKHIDYLLAHLADPAFVDKKVKLFEMQIDPKVKKEGRETLAFQRLVKITTEHYQEDPARLKELYRFADTKAKKVQWKETEKAAVALLEDLPTRRVFMKKLGDRWYMEDRDK